MKIRVEMHISAPVDQRWSALDDDDYDGAPDTPWYGKLMGWGPTASAAIADLHELKADAQEAELQAKRSDDEARDREENEL
jgi:hypothetical protein